MRCTSIYTNWRRNRQLSLIVDVARQQDEDHAVVVVDNASDDDVNSFVGDADAIYKHTNVNACWERWLLAKRIGTEYVCIMDDDLTYTREDVLRTALDYLDGERGVDAVGMVGVEDPANYWRTQTSSFKEVEIIKGRYFVVRVESLKGLDETPDRYCDDIKVSAHLKRKRILPYLRQGITNLTEGSEALWKMKDWKTYRREACREYFDAVPTNKR